jgi:uncharacterized protein (DUF934 family)
VPILEALSKIRAVGTILVDSLPKIDTIKCGFRSFEIGNRHPQCVAVSNLRLLLASYSRDHIAWAPSPRDGSIRNKVRNLTCLTAYPGSTFLIPKWL